MMKLIRTANRLSRIVLLAVLAGILLACSAYARDYDQAVTIEAMEAFTLEQGETIHGDLIVMGGKVHVLGQVEGNLVVVEGAATLGATARIEGDALAVRGVVEKDPQAIIGGKEGKLSAADLAKRMASTDNEEPTTEPVKPAEPAAPPAKVERRGDLTNFGSPINVPPDEIRIGDVVSMGGPVNIQGDVRGDVVSFGGSVAIAGDVTGDVVLFGSSIALQAGSHVHGDLVTFGGPVNQHPDATVNGDIQPFRGPGFGSLRGYLPGAHFRSAWGLLGLRAWSWTWGTISALLITLFVILLAPQATQVVADRIVERPGEAAIHGALTLLLFLPVCVLLAITCVGLIGIPILFVLLVLAGILGVVAVNLILGRKVAAVLGWSVTSIFGLAIIGALLLRAVDLLSIPPFLAIIPMLVGLCVLVIGVGGAVMTRLGTRPGGTSIRSAAGRISVTTDGTSVVIDTRARDNDAQSVEPSEEEQEDSE